MIRRSPLRILPVLAGLTWCLPASAQVAPSAPEPAGLPLGAGTEFRDRLLSWPPPRRDPTPQPTAFRLPAFHRMSSRFGVRGDPLNGGQRMHAGIDLPERFGAPVASSAAGVVVVARWARGYGNMVEIDHGDGVRSRYAHLSRILVTEGQGIDGDAIVGLVGSTGRSTGNHLHYEIRLDGRPTDPLAFVWQRPVTRSDPVVSVRQRRGAWTATEGDARLPMPSLE